MRLWHLYRPQRSWGKVMFLQASVILLTGGGYLTRYTPPGTRYTPPGTRYTPPGTRYTPPGPGTPPPRTRYTPPGPGTPPRDQVHPPRDQVHPPGTRYTPPGPGTPPRTRYTPPDQVHPPRDQVHPPGPGTPPGTRYPPRTRYPPPGPGTPPPRGQVPPLGPGTPPPGPGTPPRDQGDTVYTRAVRILLECILVKTAITLVSPIFALCHAHPQKRWKLELCTNNAGLYALDLYFCNTRCQHKERPSLTFHGRRPAASRMAISK